MQQPATKDQCAEALQGYQDSVGLSGISTSKSNTPAATPNVSSSNFPYYGRSLTCCGGCLEDFCQKPFCEMFFCHNCRTNCAVLLTHKRLHVPCMHQLQRDEQR